MTYWAKEDYDVPLEIDSQSWDHTESGHSQTGVNELTNIVGPKHGFDTVKPLKLFKKIIQIWCPPDGVVLDPYAGSGTTGHAVLELNHETESERRFILVEQGAPENGDKYARSLTWERLKRVVYGERANNKGGATVSAEPLGGGFEFRQLTKQVDAKTVLKMERDELVDVVITSHWEDDRRSGPNLIRINDLSYTYLVGKNDRDEGYFVVWEPDKGFGKLNLPTYNAILKEAKREELNPPYHIYARYGIYQSQYIRFYKIPDRILASFGIDEGSEAFNNAEEDILEEVL